MTGGHGALPYFNAFMIPFMKGKPIEKFPEPPPMPSEIKRAAEQRKREELETLAEADASAPKGIAMTPGVKIDPNAPLPKGIDTEAGPPEPKNVTNPTKIRPTARRSSNRRSSKSRQTAKPPPKSRPAKSVKVKKATDRTPTPFIRRAVTNI